MKRILSVTLLLGIAVFLLPTTALGQQIAQKPKSEKKERHIKIEKTDDKGNVIKLDTVLYSDEPFVWQGDTIGGEKKMKWISKEGFTMDSMHLNKDIKFEYKIDRDGEGNVFMFKSGKDGDRMIMPHVGPNAPFPPKSPRVMMLRSSNNKNVIDLSDPGIISYDKKLRKDGTEKITIIRKQVPETEEFEKEIIINSPAGSEMLFHGDSPKQTKRIRIMKSDDGTTKVFEDDEVIHLEGEEGIRKFVDEDGKVTIIKEIRDGDKKKVEVTIEEKKEKNN